MSSERHDQSARGSQEITSERDSFVAGRDLMITVVVGSAEQAVEALADLSSVIGRASRVDSPAAPDEAPRWEALPRPAVFPGHDPAIGAGAAIELPTRIPWTALATVPAVRWLAAETRVTGPSGTRQVELHIVPATPPTAPVQLVAPSLLMDAGRRTGLFPSSATMTPQQSAGQASALLADPVRNPSMAEAGLRVFADGQRSGWLTLAGVLHPAEGDSLDPVVEDAIMTLVTATASVARNLQDQVAIGVAIGSGSGLVTSVLPQGWLPVRYLVSNPRPVAADLARQLAEAAR